MYRGLGIRKDEKKKEESKVNRKNKEKTKIKIHIDENMIKFNSYVLYKNSSNRNFIIILAPKKRSNRIEK
jgi:hypothetical protein